MDKSTRKRDQKAALLDALDRALVDVYHNATLYYGSVDSEDERVLDYIEGSIAMSVEFELENINTPNQKGDRIEDRIVAQYGKVFCYGRGGRTCAPSAWMKYGRSSSSSVKEAEDYEECTFSYIATLLADVLAWNAYVASFCGRENMMELVASAFEEMTRRIDEENKDLSNLLTI